MIENCSNTTGKSFISVKTLTASSFCTSLQSFLYLKMTPSPATWFQQKPLASSVYQEMREGINLLFIVITKKIIKYINNHLYLVITFKFIPVCFSTYVGPIPYNYNLPLRMQFIN